MPDTMVSIRDTVLKMHKYGGSVEEKELQGTARAKTCRCGKSVHRTDNTWAFWRQKMLWEELGSE